jgi:hypothetical protein
MLSSIDLLIEATEHARDALAGKAHLVVCNIEAAHGLALAVESFEQAIAGLVEYRDGLANAPSGPPC